MKENDNYFDDIKKTKIKFSQILVLIITIMIFIFLLFEIRNLVLYTIGEKEREDVIFYNIIYKVVNEKFISDKRINVDEKFLNLGAL